MNNEKRFILFIIIVSIWMMSFPYVMKFLGFAPPPKKPAEPPVAEADAKAAPGLVKGEPAQGQLASGEPAKGAVATKGAEKAAASSGPKPLEVPVVKADELVLGSATDTSPGGYRMEARLTQKGAGIESLVSSRYDAEFEDGKAVKRPLDLIKPEPVRWPPSLAITLNAAVDAMAAPPAVNDEMGTSARDAEDWLDSITWEVVPDEQGRIRRPVSVAIPRMKDAVEGQEIVFRAKAPNGVVVTKTFRLGKGIDGLELELRFESPDRPRSVVYNLVGPHGIPIEGEWYTGTFRDLVFGPVSQGNVDPVTTSAYDVAKAGDKPTENTALPLRFAGIENQYFADLLVPMPTSTDPAERWDSRTVAMVERQEDALQKSQIGLRMTSRPIAVAPGQPVVHAYRLFAGAKTVDALAPYGADSLATYRKNQWIPFAPALARSVIAPTLDFMYRATQSAANLVGWKNGNYGIAIILLTMLVRAMMFPLGRKQALAAQKMQALQPHMKSLQEKYKDDKERLTKETFALYKTYGVNPMGGCLPALIQLPIFVGLWQALNTSFPLRHASFLWIRDLAAPDMMFPFPVEVPFLGRWFNLLPFVVVALMLVQTHLFSPPATTPEAEASQKMMKFMMVFMAFMFYKVPSGLGIYFITSSLWAVGERLLLPRISHADMTPVADVGDELGSADRGSSRSGGNGDSRNKGGGKGTSTGNVEGKRPGKIAQFWEKVLAEAQKDTTYRKSLDDREGRGRDKEKGDPRPRPRRR